jgi:excisionase family DNA binding protein
LILVIVSPILGAAGVGGTLVGLAVFLVIFSARSTVACGIASRPSMPDSTRETYWTVAELAERLRLNQQTLRNWIEHGSLPAVRVGRRVRVLNSDFERLVAGGGASAGPSAEAVAFWEGTEPHADPLTR